MKDIQKVNAVLLATAQICTYDAYLQRLCYFAIMTFQEDVENFFVVISYRVGDIS